MARLSTHVLDTANGRPAAGFRVVLLRDQGGGNWETVVDILTNADGRTDAALLSGDAFRPGRYRLDFHAGAYFARQGLAAGALPFLDVVPVQFGIGEAGGHYHVPLLVSPWSYTTYRGS